MVYGIREENSVVAADHVKQQEQSTREETQN